MFSAEFVSGLTTHVADSLVTDWPPTNCRTRRRSDGRGEARRRANRETDASFVADPSSTLDVVFSTGFLAVLRTALHPRDASEGWCPSQRVEDGTVVFHVVNACKRRLRYGPGPTTARVDITIRTAGAGPVYGNPSR